MLLPSSPTAASMASMKNCRAAQSPSELIAKAGHDLLTLAVLHVCDSRYPYCNHFYSLGHPYRQCSAALQCDANDRPDGILSRSHPNCRRRPPAGSAEYRLQVFMANHVSNLDPPALIPNIPGRTSAFLKRSLMHVPVLGWGFRLGEFIPVGSGRPQRERAGKYRRRAPSTREGRAHHYIR